METTLRGLVTFNRHEARTAAAIFERMFPADENGPVVQPATGGRSDLGGRSRVWGGIEGKTNERYQRAYQA